MDCGLPAALELRGIVMYRIFTQALVGVFLLLPLQAWAGMSVEGFSSSGPLSQETLESQYSAPSNFDYLNNLPAAPAARVQQLRSQGLSDAEISEQLVQEVEKKIHKLRREENPDYMPGVGLTAAQDRAEVRRSIQLQASGGIEGTFQYRVTEGRCTVTSNGLITGSAVGTCRVQAYEVWLNSDTGARREYTSPTLSLEFYDPCPEETAPLALASGTSRLVVGETTQISAEGGARAHCLTGNTGYLYVAPDTYCHVSESGVASASRAGSCSYTVYAGGLREAEFAATITISFIEGVSIEAAPDEDDKAEEEDKPEDENASRSGLK